MRDLEIRRGKYSFTIKQSGEAPDIFNDGSVICEERPGIVYAIAKAPRYATDEEWQYLQKRYEEWERWKTSDTFSKGKDSIHFEDDGFISIRKNGDEVAYILTPSIRTFESILKDHGCHI